MTAAAALDPAAEVAHAHASATLAAADHIDGSFSSGGVVFTAKRQPDALARVETRLSDRSTVQAVEDAHEPLHTPPRMQDGQAREAHRGAARRGADRGRRGGVGDTEEYRRFLRARLGAGEPASQMCGLAGCCPLSSSAHRTVSWEHDTCRATSRTTIPRCRAGEPSVSAPTSSAASAASSVGRSSLIDSPSCCADRLNPPGVVVVAGLPPAAGTRTPLTR